MAGTQALRFLTIFTILSSLYCEKVEKKSAIVARHHTDKCEDYGAVSKKCHMWKDLGFCFKHRKEMQFVCSRTCKFCDPGVTHWTYTMTPDENAETKTNIAYAKLSPTLEVMGKKKALYLSSKDIAGMLQTIAEKPSPSPKELAVIQGRIQKVAPTAASKNATKILAQIPQEKPQANVGGKVQIPPVEIVDEKEDRKSEKDRKNEKEDKHDAPEKPQEKLTMTGSKEIDNKLLNLMSSLVRVNQNNENKPQQEKAKSEDNENKGKDKETKSQKKEDETKDPKDNKENISQQAMPQNLQIAIPNLLQILERINGKSINITKNNPKANKTNEPQGSGAGEATDGRSKDQELNAKTKTLLAAMKLVKSIGPLPASAFNNSNLMEQLRTAAEEASVAMKLLNKTGTAEKEKEKTATVSDGNLNYNVQLLQGELEKNTKAVETTPKPDGIKPAANGIPSNQPQLNKLLTSLQDAMNAQQNQPSAATSISGRGGVAVKEAEGKPTLSEVIPFDIKIDNSDDHESAAKEPTIESKGSKKDNQQSVFESDEQKIMKILNGLDQNDSVKKKNDDDGVKEVVKEIRSAYVELGEIINGVEQDEGIKKGKKKEEDTKDDKGRKNKKEEKQQTEKQKKKKKKSKEDEGDDDDNEDDNDEENKDNDYNPYDEPKRKKKKKPLTRKDHLNKVLTYMKKAENHLKIIGGKRVKSKKPSEPEDEDADTRANKENTDWKMLATKLARQLGLVLKKMAEKDQKLLAERNRLQGVLASLAQTESQKNSNTETRGDDDDDDDSDDYNDEDRSKIIHSMATKLLNFSKTVHEAQRNNHLRTPRKKKRILHNLVSRYRNLVTKILANWVRLKSKGKKKSGIPKQGKGAKSAKRGEIIRSKGNVTSDARHGGFAPLRTAQISKSPENMEKNAKKKNEVPDKTTKGSTDADIKTVSDGEQDVLEIAN